MRSILSHHTHGVLCKSQTPTYSCLRLPATSGLQPIPIRCVTASALRRQQKNKRKGMSAPGVDDLGEYELVTSEGAPVLPSAPSPKVDSRSSAEDEIPYPVFAPKQSNVQKRSGWAWDEDDKKKDDPLPEWNPKTGFMKAKSSRRTSSLRSTSGTPSASTSAPTSSTSQAGSSEPQEADDVQVDLLSPAASTSGSLPPVSQSQVMTACVGSTFWMTVLAFMLRAYAQINAPTTIGTDEKLLMEYLALPPGFTNWTNFAILLGCAGLVTGARFALKNVWPDFKEATDRSNEQILTPLSWFDIVLVATMTGVSEELLFRGAIIPASFLDWKGVLLSGVIFGLLHNSGGRNLAFAAWAAGVGCLYGGAFLFTKNIWVPAAAHSLANFASAAIWKARNGNKGQ